MHAGPGSWANLGGLWIGLNLNLTVPQMQTHFAMWSYAKSPLFLDFRFNSIPPEALTIVTNPLLIALNQDSAGNMPKCVMNCKT